MTDYLVGTGGWAYFKVPNKSSLKAYSKVFNLVEVNHTFYEYPEVRRVERWRRTVPEDFTFAVRNTRTEGFADSCCREIRCWKRACAH